MKPGPSAMFEGEGGAAATHVWQRVRYLQAFPLAVGGVLLLLMAMDQYAIVGVILGVAVMIVVFVSTPLPGLSLIALIPLSQPFPVSLGVREIGLSAEYLVIPAFFISMLLFRIRRGDAKFDRTGIVTPWVCFMCGAATSLVLAASAYGYATAFSGVGLIYALLLSLMLFLMILDYVNSEHDVRDVMYFLFISFGIIATVGIGEYFVRFHQHPDEPIRIVSLFDTLFWERGRGNANSLGTFFAIFILMGFALRSQYSGLR